MEPVVSDLKPRSERSMTDGSRSSTHCCKLILNLFDLPSEHANWHTFRRRQSYMSPAEHEKVRHFIRVHSSQNFPMVSDHFKGQVSLKFLLHRVGCD